MTFSCMNCNVSDGHTNGGALFCWSCRDELSPEAKDLAIDAYLYRLRLVQTLEAA